MATMGINAEWIFRTELSHLGNDTKRRLIELLTSSLSLSKEKEIETRTESEIFTQRMLDKYLGTWKDNRSAEEIIAEMHASRSSIRKPLQF